MNRTPRLRSAALAFVCLLGFGWAAHGQSTTVTASHLKLSGYPISTGTVSLTPVNAMGTPIAFADGTGAEDGPTAFSCQVTAGAITGAFTETGTVSGTCTVPDATQTTPANILYSIQVCDTSTGLRTSGQCYTLQQVIGVSGASWALDHYGPPTNTTNVQTYQAAQGATLPTSCVAPSIFILLTVGGAYNGSYTCVGGVEVQLGSGATGAAGAAATIAVGTVTTGAAGSSAAVTNAGSSSAAVFNFTIPAGPAGPPGPTGPAGSGTSIELSTNGTANPSQTALNLIPGANITITPGSAGAVTIASTGGSAGVSLPGSPTAVWAGGTGTSVPDLSGNGNNIAVSTAATVAASGLTFTAAGQQVQTPVTTTYQTAMICYTHNIGPMYVTNPTTDESSIFETIPTFLGTTTQSGSTWLAAFNAPGSSGLTTGYVYPSVINSAGTYIAAQLTPVQGGPHCTVHVRNASADLFYLDGALQSNSITGGSSALSMVGNTVLGGTIVGGTPSASAWFWGTYHLVVLWPTALTAAQVAQAEAYANQSLTSRGLLAAGATPPMLNDGVSRLALVGNSITACAADGPSTCWNTLLSLTNTSLSSNIVRSALGGTAQEFMTSGAPYRENTYLAANAGGNVALLWDGINSGCRVGSTVPYQWGLAVQWAQAKHLLGIKTIIGTMINDGASGTCGGGLTPAQYQTAYNAQVYANWSQYFDNIADFSGDTVYGGATYLGCSSCAQSSTYFYTDHVHPIGPSAQIIANIASAAINAVSSNTAYTKVVPASCPAGQAISGINANGTLVCTTLATVACGTGYLHNVTLSVPSANVQGGSPLPYYPALVSFNGATTNSITLSNLASAASQVQSPTGADIIFCSATGGLLNYELVPGSFVASTGAAEFYVSIPALSSTAATSVTMYWDYASASSSANATAVWSAAGYDAVYHFGTSSSLSLLDSTSNANTLTNNGSATPVAAEFGGGAAFTTSQYLTRTSPTGLPTGATQRTLEAWVKEPTVQSYVEPIGYGTSSGSATRFAMQEQNATGSYVSTGDSAYVFAGAVVTDTNWHYLVSTVPSGATVEDNILFYLDGSPKTGSCYSGSCTAALNSFGTPLQINGYPGGTVNMGAFYVDEVRIASIARSAGWIATQYANQSNPSTFFTLGAVN